MKKIISIIITLAFAVGVLSPWASAQNDVIYIGTPEALVSFAERVNSGEDMSSVIANLTSDIAINRRVVDAEGKVNGEDFDEWQPIGTEKNPFRGIFDGNGYTVSGLYINSESQFQGLFGVCKGAEIRNIYVEDSYINVNDHAGAVVGYATEKTIISSCHNVNTSIYTKNRSGGIAGWTNDSYLYNCSSSGYCYSDRCSGGIVGDVYSGGRLYNCENAGIVEGKSLVGGISGGTTSADIQNCLNVGRVSNGYHIAGGGGSRKITNCYAYQTDEFNKNIGGEATRFSSPEAVLENSVEINGVSYTRVVDLLNAYTKVIETETPMTAWSQHETFPYINRTNLKTSFGSTASGWSREELESAYEYDLIPDTLVGEDLTKPITRLEFAAVTVKLYENLSGVKAIPSVINPFIDCADMEMLKAYNLGISVGVSDNLFDPDGLLNREQAATMLTRTFKRVTMPGWDIENDAAFPLSYTQSGKFADDAFISDWAKESVYFMNGNGIILGMENNIFAPKNITDEDEAKAYANATREQALLIAVRMVEKLK